MGVLTGTRVIDFTQAVAGASATKLLADLGADVVKIENPVDGDFARSLMPFIFQTHNRNKRSVCVDLRAEDGRAVVYRLVRNADVFVQSLRPGAAAALGLDMGTLKGLNPRLIYASFSAFGLQGPSSGRRGVDAVAQAESGMVQMQGRLLGNLSYVDTTAGLALSHAILAALLNRDRTGQADAIDVNLLDAALYMQSAPLAEFSVTGQVPDQEAYLAKFPLAGLFTANDGQIQLAAYWERDWHALCGIVGRPDLLTDERFGEPHQRRLHAAELRTILEAEFQHQPRRYWVDRLTERGILCGEVRKYDEILSDARIIANQSFEQVETGPAVSATYVRAPFRFNATAAAPTRPAPRAGRRHRGSAGGGRSDIRRDRKPPASGHSGDKILDRYGFIALV
jgi:CoA:oxalate CoA-transferase